MSFAKGDDKAGDDEAGDDEAGDDEASDDEAGDDEADAADVESGTWDSWSATWQPRQAGPMHLRQIVVHVGSSSSFTWPLSDQQQVCMLSPPSPPPPPVPHTPPHKNPHRPPTAQSPPLYCHWSASHGTSPCNLQHE